MKTVTIPPDAAAVQWLAPEQTAGVAETSPPVVKTHFTPSRDTVAPLKHNIRVVRFPRARS